MYDETRMQSCLIFPILCVCSTAPLGKRSWKLYFCRLRELLLSLAPDENSKATVVQTIQPLKLHHAIATVASDYRKRPYVFCLTLADKSQYLFQSSDSREMNSWIDNLNLNAAKFSSPALEAPCGSSKKFEKPLLPSAISRFSSREQLITHQAALAKWEEELEDLVRFVFPIISFRLKKIRNCIA
jgi:PH/SEC7 domain-containing protein